MIYVMPIFLVFFLLTTVYHSIKVNKALAWQDKWEQNGELPLDRKQNERLDKLESTVYKVEPKVINEAKVIEPEEVKSLEDIEKINERDKNVLDK